MVDGSWTALLGPSHQLAVRMRIMRIIVYRACVHMYRMRIANALRRRRGLALSLTLARACAAKGYCSRSVGLCVGYCSRSVGRFVRRFVRRWFVRRRFVRRRFVRRPFVRRPFVRRPFVRRPFVRRPFVRRPFVRRPFVRRPFVRRPFVRRPFVRRPFVRRPFVRRPFVRRPFVRRPFVRRPFVRRPFVRRPFVRRFVRRFFLSNRGCCRYQTWICGYVQRALGTARVWNVVVKEQRVYGGRLKFTLMCTFLVKAESGGCQTWICG